MCGVVGFSARTAARQRRAVPGHLQVDVYGGEFGLAPLELGRGGP